MPHDQRAELKFCREFKSRLTANELSNCFCYSRGSLACVRSDEFYVWLSADSEQLATSDC